MVWAWIAKPRRAYRVCWKNRTYMENVRCRLTVDNRKLYPMEYSARTR